MVLIEIKVPWLTPDHLERPLVITRAYTVSGKYGDEIEIEALSNYTPVRFSCYGANKAFMVYQFGADTDKWVDKVIIVGLQQREWKGSIKEMRVFRVPK